MRKDANKNLRKMTSTYMTNSTINYGGFNHRVMENNFQNYSNYGLNYFNDSASSAEYSDGYQSSISPPIESPELSSCRIKQNFQQIHQSDFYCLQNNFQSHQIIKSEEIYKKNFHENFTEIENFKSPQKSSFKSHMNMGMKKLIQTHSNKPIIVAPEVLKKRRVAANARERRRMNNLNFAFDR